MRTRVGIDIGGSGIKGAIVDVTAGALDGDRRRIPTPQPATPDAVVEAIREVVDRVEWDGSDLGCTIPGVITDGVVRSAAHIDQAWIGLDASSVIGDALGCSVTVLNDADAAGMAEMKHGAGRSMRGVVLMLTFGTGIGSALFCDGALVPNTELGHLEVDGVDGETRAAARVHEDEGLSYEEWASRVTRYLRAVETVLWPDLIVLGGGISKHADRFLHFIESRTPIVAAELKHHAGIIGAALAAEEAA